MKSVGELSEND